MRARTGSQPAGQLSPPGVDTVVLLPLGTVAPPSLELGAAALLSMVVGVVSGSVVVGDVPLPVSPPPSLAVVGVGLGSIVVGGVRLTLSPPPSTTVGGMRPSAIVVVVSHDPSSASFARRVDAAQRSELGSCIAPEPSPRWLAAGLAIVVVVGCRGAGV